MKNERSDSRPILKRGFQYFFVSAVLLLLLYPFEQTTPPEKGQVVRLAKIKVDPAKVENYHKALREEIETSLRVEPGVLMLYAVSEENDPTSITILEIYADTAAYRTHLETAHFKKYKSSTTEMITNLELMAVNPIFPDMKLKK